MNSNHDGSEHISIPTVRGSRLPSPPARVEA